MLNSEAAAETGSASTGRIAPFGKYLLLQRVSVGGMAEVFKALPSQADRIDQIVAIKRILPNIAEDKEFIGMFIDEARIAGQLTHPNICRIYELGRVNNDHYIAMQFLWGRDLLKVMNRFKKAGRFVSPSMAAYIGAKALSALHYAHHKCDEHGQPLHIIHRDVSPQNIIVGYSGQVKLIDFGVARAATQSQKTQAGILKGKFGYMSPEMIRGLPIDYRSDVFAMGICLHELLTSTRLFYGETDFATLELVRDARVLPPSQKNPEIPRELDQIVMKALSRDVDQRFQSAEEMQLALEQFLRTHYPSYGQGEVGSTMRQAFHSEVQRERERLEIFWGMLERGELVRGAEVPALSREPNEGGGPHASPVGALIEATDQPEYIPQPLAHTSGDEDDELQDEQTQIFFSATELDEIRGLEGSEAAAAARRPATLSDMIPPPSAQPERLTVPPFAASGTYQRTTAVPEPQPGLFTPAFEGFAAGFEGFAPAAEPVGMASEPAKRGMRPVHYALVAGVAALGLLGYAWPRWSGPATGAVEVQSVGDPDALVRVDGIVRGNPPLLLDGLSPGRHEVEIEATGFELAKSEVQVEGGQTHTIKVALQPKGAEPSVATLPASPSVEEIAAVAPEPASAARERARPAATKPIESAGSAGSRDELPLPVVQGSGASETQVGETLNSELVAAKEGELLISTVPWSHVFVDDQDTGRDTPIRALRVPAGQHRIGLRTPDDVMHQVDIDVRAGQVVRIIRRF